jgi:uncharacterized protein (DUF2344 family)
MSDTLRHRILRLRFAVYHPLIEYHPSALLNKLISVFKSAGVPPAMSKEKRSKPIAHLAYPLPAGIEGLEEWADITLKTGLSDPLDMVTERLRACCPEGLNILDIEQVPLHASPVAELCETAHWSWLCPDELFSNAVLKLETFVNSISFQINKTGKIEGKKSLKSIEVRHLIQELRVFCACDSLFTASEACLRAPRGCDLRANHSLEQFTFSKLNCSSWHGMAVKFSTRILQGQALNPQKLFAGILDIGPEQLGKFRRERIELRHDPKLERFDKFAPKLRNLYEDAVLLESTPNIKIYDDDEDGVLRI